MNHKQSLDRPTTLPTRKANPQTTKRHQVPSRSPSLNQPSLTAHSKTFHLPLFQRTPYLSLISSSKYVPKRDKGAMQVGTLNHLHSVISGRVPKEIAPEEIHLTHSPRQEPSNPIRSKPRVSDGANPHPWEPRPGYREPTKPGPHLQPLRVPGRVTSSSNTESIVDTKEVVALVSSDGATASPTGSRPARLPRSPPPPTQLLFGLRRRRWNSNRSGRHLSRSLFLRKRGGVAEARAVKPTGLDRRPGREALAGRHLN